MAGLWRDERLHDLGRRRSSGFEREVVALDYDFNAGARAAFRASAALIGGPPTCFSGADWGR